MLGLGLTFLGFSLENANTFFLGKQRFAPPVIHNLTVWWSLVIGGGIPLLIYGLYPDIFFWIFPGISHTYLTVALLLIPFSIYTALSSGILIGLDRLDIVYKLIFVIQLLIFVGAVVVLVWFQRALPGIIGVVSLITIAHALLLLGVLKRQGVGFYRLQPDVVRDSVSYAGKFHLGMVAHFLHLKVDQLMVNFFIGASGVGWYVLAVSLAEKLWLVTTIFRQAGLYKVTSSDPAASASLTNKLTRSVSFAGMIGVAGMFLFGQPFIRLVFGEAYLPSVPALYWLLPGIWAMAVAPLLSTFVAMQLGRPGIPTIIAMFTLLVNVGLNWLLTPRLGVSGTAISTTISYLLTFALITTIYVRSTHYSVSQVFIPNREDFDVYKNLIGRVKDSVLSVKV
ncbi:MAG: hypothetical protein D6768_13425 [Chloroflexi bacterium]|nr:MAG: hypothetical protein D6768_13425 [Chloroflexota bacterium]